jgi:uncharacterized protein (DUF927 family)
MVFLERYIDEQDGHYGMTAVFQDGNSAFEPYGRCVYITRIIEIHETNEVLLVLEYDYNGRKVTTTLPRGNLKKSVLLDYAKEGMDVFEHTVITLLKFLQWQEEMITPMTGHKNVGWDTYTGDDGVRRDFFKGYKGIGYISEYLGDFIIKPTGQKEDYQDFISKHIISTPLELAVAVGLAAVLVGFIGSEVECDNLFVHIFGDTSSGKTTFGVVAVGMGSKPEFKGHTLARRYNGTENALLQVMVGNTGLPVCFDEAKEAKIRDFSGFIYSIESGTEKLRLDKDASVKRVGEYHTSIVSTGEFSLSDDSERATGKEIRLQQFGNIVWTRNAHESELIKGFFRKKYGLPCVLFASHLLKIGKEATIEYFTRNRKKFIKQSKVTDAFTERLSIKYGMILAAAELANEAMGLSLSYDEIMEMLIQNEMETSESRDIAQVAYDYVLGQINIFHDNFSFLSCINKPEIIPPQKDTWGLRVTHKPALKINKKKCYVTIYVQKDKLAEILLKGNFKDVSVIVKKWKERDLLDYEEGRNTRFRKISPTGTKVHVYGLRVFGNPDKDASAQEANPARAGVTKTREGWPRV